MSKSVSIQLISNGVYFCEYDLHDGLKSLLEKHLVKHQSSKSTEENLPF